MEISRRTDYGIRVVLDLASTTQDALSATREIARRQKIPSPFLAKIIAQLSVAGLVTTHRGAGGGVALARPPAQISLLQVIEALDGPVRLNRCLIQPQACPNDGHCPVHQVLAEAQAALTSHLASTTFDVLVGNAADAQT